MTNIVSEIIKIKLANEIGYYNSQTASQQTQIKYLGQITANHEQTRETILGLIEWLNDNDPEWYLEERFVNQELSFACDPANPFESVTFTPTGSAGVLIGVGSDHSAPVAPELAENPTALVNDYRSKIDDLGHEIQILRQNLKARDERVSQLERFIADKDDLHDELNKTRNLLAHSEEQRERVCQERDSSRSRYDDLIARLHDDVDDKAVATVHIGWITLDSADSLKATQGSVVGKTTVWSAQCTPDARGGHMGGIVPIYVEES